MSPRDGDAAEGAVSDRLEAALEYARIGWFVFPAPPGTVKKSRKAAKYSGGRRWGATCDPDQIKRDWQRWPSANIGVATRRESRFFVVEADTAAGHVVDGIGNLGVLEARHGRLPNTVEAVSPSGSRHLYFRWPTEGAEVRNSESRIAPGIDCRGEGGMVIGVPGRQTIKTFIEECLDQDLVTDLAVSAVYPVFRDWQEKQGIKRPWTQHAMTRKLSDQGDITVLRKDPTEPKGASFQNCLVGWRLKP